MKSTILLGSMLLISNLLTSCKSYVAEDLTIAGGRTEIDLSLDIIGSTSTGSQGFDWVQYYRDHHNIETVSSTLTTSFIIPKVYINPKFDKTTGALNLSSSAGGA